MSAIRLWWLNVLILCVLVPGRATGAGAGGECPARDPECAAVWLDALTSTVECERGCPCKKLEKQRNRLARATAASLEAPGVRSCERSLEKAGVGAKKLGKAVAKALKRGKKKKRARQCVEPGAAGALGEAARFVRKGLGAMARSGSCALRLGPLLETDNASTATIGPDGGALETSASDGTRFALEVPPAALLEDTAITITPALATGTPFSGGPLAALQLEPSGLALWVPGTLTVDLPSAPDPDALVGFGWDGSGWNPALELIEATGARLVFSVAHFSGLGAALAAPADLAALAAATPSGSANAYTSQIAATCLATSGADPAAIEDALRRWFDDLVAPALQGAKSDPELTQALRDYKAWSDAVRSVELLCGLAAPPDLGNRESAGRALAAAAIQDGIQRADVRCRALGTIDGAEDALRWQAIAEALGLAGPGSGLEMDDVLGGLCLEILYRNTDYTSSPRAGVTSPLTVEAEISFPANSSVPFYQPIRVDVTGSGTQEASATGSTDSSGVFSAPFTPLGGQEVVLEIEACLDFPGYPKLSANLCQTAIVGRGLEVTPPTAQVQSGATQQFAALLVGDPYANVTWSATSGSIDANGLFTAGPPGPVTVTAVDNAGSGATASATVTVGANFCDFGSFVPDALAFVRADDAANFVDQVVGPPMPATAMASDGTNRGSATGTFGRLAADAHVEWPPSPLHSAVASVRFSDRLVIDSGVPGRRPRRFTFQGRLLASGTSGARHYFDLDLRFGFGNSIPDRLEASTGGTLDEDDTFSVDLFRDGAPTDSAAAFPLRIDLYLFNRIDSVGVADADASFQWLGITGVYDESDLPITGYTICSASGTDWRTAR